MLIKHKLIANTGILVTAMLLILWVLNFSMSALETDIDVARGIGDIEVEVLQLRRAEKDFLARKDLKYLAKFEAISQRLTQDITTLNTAFEKMGDAHPEILTMRKVIADYQQYFKEIVESQQRIGLNPKDGLYGKLRDAVHETESLIAGKDFQILSVMLQLRRNEKDFMLRLDDKYVSKWNDNAEKFVGLVENSLLSADEQEAIIDSISRYQAAFMNLVSEEKVLGYTAKEGLQGQMRTSVHQIDEMLETLIEVSHVGVKEHTEFIDLLSYSLLGAVVIVSVAFASYISKSILNSVNHVKDTMNRVAQTNDLTIVADSKSDDELGEVADTFNLMIANFRNLIVEVNQSVTTLNVATQSLSEGIHSTNEGVDAQIQQTDMVATAVTEMVATVEEIASNTSEAASKAESTNQNAIMGKEGVNKTIAQIDELSNNLLDSEKVAQNLEKDSDTIASVLDVIRGIAEQTNLLALNAAIEAARAGEQGRGFAVVADEVRTLASRTQDSTQEIESIINSLQGRTQEIVAHMAECRSKGEESAEQASSAGTMLEEITQDVTTIMEMSTTIATAIHEQTTVASEVNKHIVGIRDVAEKAGNESIQNGQMSEELAQQAEVLHNEVKRFIV